MFTTIHYHRPQQRHSSSSLLIPLLLLSLLHLSHADVGTAAQYSPPFLPTSCYGWDTTQFPASDLFAAAGDGIWDGGASCGRQYLVRCISAEEPGTCIPGVMIQVRIIDHAVTMASSASRDRTTMVLSDTAFAAVANSSASAINIEFREW